MKTLTSREIAPNGSKIEGRDRQNKTFQSAIFDPAEWHDLLIFTKWNKMRVTYFQAPELFLAGWWEYRSSTNLTPNLKKSVN